MRGTLSDPSLLGSGGGDGFGDGFGADELVLVEGAVGAADGPGGGVGVAAVVLILGLQTGEFGFEFGEFGGDFWAFGIGLGVEQVALLVGVGGEVEQFIRILFPVVDELVGGGAHAEMGDGVVMPWVVIVAVIDAGAPVGWGFAAQQRGDGAALHGVGHGQAGEIEEGGGEVDVGDELVGHGASLDAWAFGKQGHVQAGFVHEAFVVEAEVAEIPTVVSGVDDDGVFGETACFEVIEDFANAVVHALHAGEVVAHVFLVLPLHQFFAGEQLAIYCELHRFDLHPLLQGRAFEVSGWGEFQIAAGEIAGDGLLIDRQSGGPSGIVVPEGLWLGDDLVLEHLDVAGGGFPSAVRGFLMEHQEERLVGGARF